MDLLKRLENKVNGVLTRVFGTTESGDRRVWFHAQNLNENSKGDLKGLPWSGRWWLHVGNKTVHRLEWKVGKNWYLGGGLRTDVEDDALLWNFGTPVGSIYLGHYIPGGVRKLVDRPFWKNLNEKYGGYKDSHRYTALDVFKLDYSWMDDHHVIRWNLLKFDWGWSNKMPKWMEGRLDIAQALFGKMKYTKEVTGKQDVMIPMPEGLYPATVEMEYCTWKRARLPWNSNEGSYAKVEIDIGIPHEGKGENSWDCGEDALFGISRRARTVEEAIGAVVQSVLESRRKYNGNRNAVYPSPEERYKAVMARREAAKKEPQPEATAASEG